MNPFVNRKAVEPGTYMMRRTSELTGDMYGFGDISVFGDVPTNMQVRVLNADGSTRLGRTRLIQCDEPFFVTGQALVSKTGNIILVEVIPPDGFPGWVQLDSIPDEDGNADATVKYWFAQNFSSQKEREAFR
jgi:hypothetical protein